MPEQYRRGSAGSRFILASILAIALIVIDSTSAWLTMPRNGLSVVLRPIQEIASIPQQFSRTVTDFLASEPDLQIAYDNLRQEYFELRAQTLLLKALERENSELRSYLGAQAKAPSQLLLADLVSTQVDPDNHRFVVNRGLRDDAFEGQAVVDDQGIVGQITAVLPLTSTVTLITDPGHAMPAQVSRNGLRAVVQGTGQINRLTIPFLNANTDIRVGDTLLSSGIGGRFPAGYPLATIDEVVVLEDQAFLSVSASPFARLDRTNRVLLLTNQTP